jgi:hypothetical protein
MVSVVQLYERASLVKYRRCHLIQLTEVLFSTYRPGSGSLFAAVRTSRPQPRQGLEMLNMWPWQMGDPSVEVSHVAFQEAEGMVMKTILRRYYCFPLH